MKKNLPAMGVLLGLWLCCSGAAQTLSRRPLWAWGLCGALFLICAIVGKLWIDHGEDASTQLHSKFSLGALVLTALTVLLLPLGSGTVTFFLCAASVVTALVFPRRETWFLSALAALFCLGDGISLVHANGFEPREVVALVLKSLTVVAFAALPAVARRLGADASHQRSTGTEKHRGLLRDNVEKTAAMDGMAETSSATFARAEELGILEAAPEDGRAEASQQLAQSGLEEWLSSSVVHAEGAVGALLDMAKMALNANACCAFLLSKDGSRLFLTEYRMGSGSPRTDMISSKEGILGAVVERKLPIRLEGSGGSNINYYEAGVPKLSAVAAVPIVDVTEDNGIRGVLVTDRVDDLRPFSPSDEAFLRGTATEILRAVQRERLLTLLKKSHDESGRLYGAIDRLNRTDKTAQALEVALEEASVLASLDFAALTLIQVGPGEKIRHVIARATDKKLEGYEFGDNRGLVASAIRHVRTLPERDVALMDKVVIFDGEESGRDMTALKVIPLSAGEKIIGSLVAIQRHGGGPFDGESLSALHVLAMQAAQSIQRADLFERTENLATIDGLTGLMNHRTFQTRCDEALGLASRYGKKVSLMLTDIDHFKRVNDTYGHPTGDAVLKGVAKILQASSRETDVVARYGGEEFIVIMPETDMQGSQVIAERIRKAIEREVFTTDQGDLKVTLSLGISTFPDSATQKQALIDLADQCLYFAKEHGRNQSVTVAQMREASSGR